MDQNDLYIPTLEALYADNAHNECLKKPSNKVKEYNDFTKSFSRPR